MTKQKTFPRRLLCVILSVCMIVSCMAGMTFTVSAATYTETSTFPTTAGYWKLTQNVEIPKFTRFETGVNLDLNGKTVTITGTAYLYLPSNVSVTMENGYIKSTSTYKNIIEADSMARLTLNGVSIDGQDKAHTAIYANSSTEVKISKHDTFGRSVIRNCGNYSVEQGAGILFKGSKLDIRYTDFTGNKAKDAGGAIYIKSIGEANIFESTFKNNYAQNQAGAIYCDSANVYFYNSEASGNIIESNDQKNGAGIYVTDYCTLHLGDSTGTTPTKITENKAANGSTSSGKYKASNLVINKKIDFASWLKGDASIGIINLIGHTSDTDFSGEFSHGISKRANEKNITSDIEGYKLSIQYDNPNYYYYIKKTRTLTLTNGNIGSASSGITSKVLGSGETVWVYADKAPAGKIFDHWTASGITLSDTEKKSTSFCVKMPDSDVSLTAEYVTDVNTSYDIDISNGTAYFNGTAVNSAIAGQVITVKANEDNEDQRFSSWISTNVTFADKTSRETTFTMPANKVIITADYTFSHNVYVTNGTADREKALSDVIVTITANPAPEGKIFDKWTGFSGGGKVTQELTFADASSETTTFTMPGRPVYVTANYKNDDRPEYNIEVVGGIAGKETAREGAEITIIAGAAPEGKMFDKWTGIFKEGSGGKYKYVLDTFADETLSVTTFIMPAGDVQITSSYKDDDRKPHRINLTNCRVTGLELNEYGYYWAKAGEYIDVVAVAPEIGKKFKEWQGTYYDSVKHEYKNIEFTNKAAETTTFFMPDDIVYIEALYIDDGITRYTVTVDKGTATPAKAAKGETVTLKADEPETGMKFDKWRTLPAGEVTFADPTAAETTFTMPDKPVVIVADFKAASGVKHSISVTDGTADKTEAADGEIVTITANTPPAGKVFDNWSSADGITFDDPNAEVTTFTMPDKAVSITANYTDDIYTKHTITVLDGTASPALAALNETVTVTADTPETGMVFYKWRSVPDGSVTFADQTASTTTFPMIAENVVIVATFKSTDSTKHTISVVDGTATPDTAAAGETVTVTADYPELGMEFDQWKCVPAGSVTFADPYASVTTFTMPDEYVVAVATYKIKAVTLPDFVMGSTNAPNFKAVTKAINAQVKAGTAKDAYIIEIPATFTEKSVALPKGNFSITLTGGTLTTGSIAANCDTIINCALKPAGKAINIKVAANKTVNIKKPGAFGTISGAKGSKLIVGADITAETVKAFNSVETGLNTITVTKALSNAVIINASLKYNSALAKKISIPAITGNLVITLEGNSKSGVPIFTYSGTAFDNSKVTILNTDEGKLLEAFLYKKEVRAEIPDLFLLNGENCPSWEFALTKMIDANTDYTVTLTGNTKITKFALPAKAKSLTINGADMILDLDKTKSITAKCNLTLNNIKLTAGGTPVAVKTGKFDLTLNDANVGAVNAGKLTVNGTVVADGAVSVTELNSILAGTHFTLQSLAITKNGITTGSEGIMLKLIDKTGAPVQLEAGTKNNVAVKTFKPANYVEGSLLLDAGCIKSGTGLLKFEKNKLILT